MRKVYVVKTNNVWRIYDRTQGYFLCVKDRQLKPTVVVPKMDMGSRRNAIRQIKAINPKAKNLGLVEQAMGLRIPVGSELFEI